MPSKPQPASSLYKDLRLPAKQAWQGSEDSFQIACAGWLKHELYLRKEPQLFWHTPNGGNRSKREGARLKLMGVKPGVYDCTLALKSGEFSGLYAELKNAKGTLSDAQKTFGEEMSVEGFLCVIINDIETFKRVFTYYINQRKQK